MEIQNTPHSDNIVNRTLHRTSVVTGLFRDRDSAERAYRAVTSRGYTNDEVNVIMSDDARKKHFGDDTVETAAAAAVGTTLLIPGLGLVIAGPLAAGIAGAGAGGIAGGLVGALIGWGIPEEHIKHYEEGLKSGGILLSVKPHNDEDAAYFEQDWKSHRAEEVYH